MNCKKAIKDLRELNSQLKGQYRDEQNRNYCLQCKIDKIEKEKQELIEYLKENISILDNILENEKDEDKIYNCLIRRTTFKEVLNKIEKE